MKKNPKINHNTIVQRNPDQLFSLIDDEVVMLNIEHEEYLNLNLHASYIWTQLAKPIFFSELLVQLCSAFNVEEDICYNETKSFLEEFIEKEIIQIVHEKAS